MAVVVACIELGTWVGRVNSGSFRTISKEGVGRKGGKADRKIFGGGGVGTHSDQHEGLKSPRERGGGGTKFLGGIRSL